MIIVIALYLKSINSNKIMIRYQIRHNNKLELFLEKHILQVLIFLQNMQIIKVVKKNQYQQKISKQTISHQLETQVKQTKHDLPLYNQTFQCKQIKMNISDSLQQSTVSDLSQNIQQKQVRSSNLAVIQVMSQTKLMQALQTENQRKFYHLEGKNSNKFKPKYIHQIIVSTIIFQGNKQQTLKTQQLSPSKNHEQKLYFQNEQQYRQKLKTLFRTVFFDRQLNSLYKMQIHIDSYFAIKVPNLESFIYLSIQHSILNRYRFSFNELENIYHRLSSIEQSQKIVKIPCKYPQSYYVSIYRFCLYLFQQRDQVWHHFSFLQILIIAKYLIHEKHFRFNQKQNPFDCEQVNKFTLSFFAKILDKMQLNSFKSSSINNKIIIYSIIGVSQGLKQQIFNRIYKYIKDNFKGVQIVKITDKSFMANPNKNLALQNEHLYLKYKEFNSAELYQNLFLESRVTIMIYDQIHCQNSLKNLLFNFQSNIFLRDIFYEVKLIIPAKSSIQSFYDQNLKNQINYGHSVEIMLFALLQKIRNSPQNQKDKQQKIKLTQQLDKEQLTQQQQQDIYQQKNPIKNLSQVLHRISKDFINIFPFNKKFMSPENFIGNISCIQIDYQSKTQWNFEDEFQIKENLQILLKESYKFECFHSEQNLLWYFLQCLQNIDIQVVIDQKQIQNIIFTSFQELPYIKIEEQ